MEACISATPVFPQAAVGAGSPFHEPSPRTHTDEVALPGPPAPGQPALGEASPADLRPSLFAPQSIKWILEHETGTKRGREPLVPAISLHYHREFGSELEPALPPFCPPLTPGVAAKRGEATTVRGARWTPREVELRFLPFTQECPDSHLGMVLEMLRRRFRWMRL